MENKKINITINRSEPNSQEIQEMQNFEQVLQQYKQAPKAKNTTKIKWIGGSLIAAAASLVLYFYFYVKPLNTEPIIIAPQQKPFIQKPTSIAEKPFEVFEIVSGMADTLHTQTGARIIIPACKFTSQGKEVNGQVQIKYREFKNPIDIALSGIPMTYDSAGKTYFFESAGMFEIRGEQASTNLEIASACGIVVEIIPTKNEDRFNAYFLDTIQKNWVNIGKPVNVVTLPQASPDKPNPVPVEPQPAQVAQETEILIEEAHHAAPALVKPLQPQKANESLPHFTLAFDPTEFPELTAYEKTVFEVKEADKKRSIELFGIKWSNIKYKTIKSGISYLVIMELFDKKSRQVIRHEEMEVHPVIKEEDYDQAMREFQKKDLFYKETVAKQLKEKKDQRQQALEFEKSRAKKRIERLANTPPSYGTIREAFAVKNFGIYNSDYPLQLANNKTKMVEITDAKGNYEKVDILYQLILNKGLFMSNYFNQGVRCAVSFESVDSTLLFALMPDGKVAYLLPTESKQFWNNQENRLVLNKTEKKFMSAQEIVDYFAIKDN